MSNAHDTFSARYKEARLRMGMSQTRPIVRFPEPKKEIITANIVKPTALVVPPIKVPEAVKIASARARKPEVLDALAPVKLQKKQKIPMCAIQFAVCDYFRLTHDELVGYRRQSRYTLPRHVAMYLCKKLGSRSYSEIARAFSGRDHTTVLHAIARIEGLLRDWQDLHTAHAILLIQTALIGGEFVYWGA